jgi:Zn-dependent peptidase ImmA (M78 family)
MVEAERDAQELRARAWRKKGPAGFFLPIDPFRIAMDLGLKVFTCLGMTPEISGMLKKPAGYADPEILLNGDDSRNRHRFTCAHELGHYVLRMKDGHQEAWDHTDGRDLFVGAGPDRDEIWANYFAAELLMPRDIVIDCAEDTNAPALAVDFGVAADAMRFRLETLGVV